MPISPKYTHRVPVSLLLRVKLLPLLFAEMLNHSFAAALKLQTITIAAAEGLFTLQQQQQQRKIAPCKKKKILLPPLKRYKNPHEIFV